MSVEGVDAGGVRAEWIEAGAATRGQLTIVYFHAAELAPGSAMNHRVAAGRFAVETGARVLSVGYRWAPEYSRRAAVEDCVVAYAWLVGEGLDPAKTAFIGDNAAKDVVLAVRGAAQDYGLPLPLVRSYLESLDQGDMTATREALVHYE